MRLKVSRSLNIDDLHAARPAEGTTDCARLISRRASRMSESTSRCASGTHRVLASALMFLRSAVTKAVAADAICERGVVAVHRASWATNVLKAGSKVLAIAK